MSLTTNYLDYVARHIHRIHCRHGANEQLILDSKWRIASALDFNDLNPDGSLTPDQVAAVDAYIEKFKTTKAGQSAIAKIEANANE